MYSLKSVSKTWSPSDGATLVSDEPSVLNGVNSISSILLVSSPPDNLKNALIDEVDLTLAATLISSAVEAFARLIDLVMYAPADEPPCVALS